jgi:hypothetical protein
LQTFFKVAEAKNVRGSLEVFACSEAEVTDATGKVFTVTLSTG